MHRELRSRRATPWAPLLLLFCSSTAAENSAEAYFDALAKYHGKNVSTTRSTPSMRGARRGYCTESNLFNCMGNTDCCDPSAQCFAKDAKVAVCKTQCTPGIHLDDPPQWQTPWSCEVVGGDRSAVGQCSASYRGNCLNNPSCCDGSFTCYERDGIYGACLPSCRPGIHWQDPPQYRYPWSCRVISPWNPSPPPAPSPPQCTASYTANCRWSPACCEQGFQCYEKNGGYGACLPYCNPGIHESEPPQYRSPWSCRLIQPGGSPAPPPPPPPAPAPTPPPSPPSPSCSASYSHNCLGTPTCCDASFTCYEKSGNYGACLPYCEPGIHWQEPPQFRTPWTCRVVGGSPAPPPPPPPPPAPVPSPPPPPQCSASYSENCLSNPTCCDPAMTCFMKDAAYGQCLPSCAPGIHWNDPPQFQTPWACIPVGGPGPPATTPAPPVPTPPVPTPPPTPPPSPSPPSPTPPSTTSAPGDSLEIPFAEESLYQPSGADLLTFHMYRAQGHSSYPPLNVNTGNLAGIMWYIQNEVVSGAYGSGNKFGIERILRFKVTMKATQPLIDSGMNFGVRVAFDFGNCTGPSCVFDWGHYGYNIGCNNLGSFPFPKFETYYAGGVWYSLPGACPQMPYYSQTAQCEQLQPGGLCDSPTGAGDCTWSYQEEGEQIWLGELYGASNMSMDQFWNNSENATANQFKIKIARDLFAKRYGAELPNPPCDFNFDQFYKGVEP